MYQVDKIQYLQIGVQGENEANNIEIDMTAWAEAFPEANFYILFKPHDSADPAVPVTTSYDQTTKVLTWTVTASVTQVVGVGYTEIRAIDGSVDKKSRIIPTSVENSVSGGVVVNPPAAYEDWVTKVLNAGTDAKNSAAAAMAYSQGKEIKFEIGDDDGPTGMSGHLLFYFKDEDEEDWEDYIDLGPVDAYGLAVLGGYTGTRTAFSTDMGNSGTNATNAANSAAEAEEWATGGSSGTPSATNNAQYYAGQAADSATSAAASASTASAAYNVNLLAPNYSTESTYAVGDHVIYSGGYYECISAISTAEAWTAAHWKQITVGGESSSLKSALNSDFNNIVKEIGKVGIALETSNLSNMGVSGTTGEQMGSNSKRISNINVFPIVPNMPLHISYGTGFLTPYIYYFKNGAFVNYDASYTDGKTYDADAIRILFFKNPSTSDITAQEVAEGFTIYQEVASGSYDSRLEAAEEKFPDIDNRFCDFQIPMRFGQLNTTTGAILVNPSTTTRLVSKLTKKGLFNYIVRTEAGINYYVGYYNASKVFQKAVGYNTGNIYQLEDYPFICVMLAHSNGSAFSSVDCGIYLSETDSIQTIQTIVTELNKNKKQSLASLSILRISQFISNPSEDSNADTIVTCDGGDSYSTAGQWIALFLNKIRIENIANKYLKWEKIQIKWEGDSDFTDIPKANCRCFVNTSFTFAGATDIESGEMALVDDILANYTDGEVYIGASLSPVFAPTHVYQNGSTWHIDPFTAKFVAYVYDDYYGAVKSHVADQLANGLTGEKIAQAIENNGASDYSLIAYGDSLTTGAGATDTDHTYWGVCASVLNMKNRIGFGYGGSKSRPIAFTAGALTGYVPPNTRSFALKFADLTTDISINANVLNGKTVIIGDNEYTIGQTGVTAYTLPNSYTPVGYYVPVTVKNSRYTADVYIIWVGTNDGGMQWDIVDAMIAKLPHKKYAVIGLTRLGTDTSVDDEKKGYEKYGSHYLNIRMQIISSAFAIIGKTPTAEDTTAMNAGLMPPSLMSDATHFNDDGYEAIGKILAKHIQSLGYSYQTAQ